MQRMMPQKQMTSWEPFVYYDKYFTPSECEAIINLAKTIKPQEALTGAGNDKSIRSSEVVWLHENEQSKWIFDKLESVCESIRANWYPFTLSGFGEPIQITRYFASEGGHYDTHVDVGGGNTSNRKLSLVVLLSDPTEFKGGELEILAITEKDKTVKQLTQGTVVAFPSWALHRVNPVTEGSRTSLVCWVSGPPFT